MLEEILSYRIGRNCHGKKKTWRCEFHFSQKWNFKMREFNFKNYLIVRCLENYMSQIKVVGFNCRIKEQLKSSTLVEPLTSLLKCFCEWGRKSGCSLHKKWGFSLRASLVNVTKSEEVLHEKLHFLCSGYWDRQCSMEHFRGVFRTLSNI